MPGRDEFAMAAERFTGDERRIVDDYLSRGYLYAPMVSEHRFNDAILRPMIGSSKLFGFAFGVQGGPPRMWLERAETVKYIAKNSFLTLRAEEIITAETVAYSTLFESCWIPE